MSAIRLNLIPCVVAGLFAGSLNLALAADDGAATSGAPIRADFLDAVYLPGHDRIVVAGHFGLVGMVEVGDAQARIKVISEHPDADFSALEKISDTEVLIGSSTGRIYHFDGTTITEIAALSEFDEPILDIAANENGVWVVGARGLVARSADGKEFEVIEISDVTQAKVEFPGAHAADWYIGVSNLDVDSIEFTASFEGKPAINDEHFILYSDEGFIQFQTDLDDDPLPTIVLKFDPGPPFRPGDVTWNVVLLGSHTVTLAGEFGMILQSEDNGETWVRRDVEIVPREPEPAYWMSGVQKGDEMWLAGAAGVSQRSNDRGVTWTDNPKPGREGIFGITLSNANEAIISGAVGLAGILHEGDWKVADRTRLKLLSWLRTPVPMPDGSVVLMGGRAAAIRFKDGEFKRVPVTTY